MSNSTKYIYRLIADIVNIEEQEILAYGISVTCGDTVRSYPDLSPDRERVSALVDTLNKMDAESVHLEDIFEDFLP